VNAPLRSAIYAGRIVHARLEPPAHRFEYPLFMWLIDLDEVAAMDGRVTGFGYNRPSVVSFRDADHLAGTREPLRDQVRRLVEHAGVTWPGGSVRLLTHCRMLGYVFNPVSLWYCHDRDGRLAVLVAEVNNTFGGRHCYVSPAQLPTGAAPGRPVGPVRWRDRKVFHVSPFLTVEGQYAFSIGAPRRRLAARIDLRWSDAPDERPAVAPRLVTALVLRREPITRNSVAGLLVRYPLMTLRVIGAIHWEALRLRLKGARYHPPPLDDSTAGRATAAWRPRHGRGEPGR
jgi:DUF1365 family protein